MFLLDTNVISELRRSKSDRQNRNVARWAESQPIDSLYLSVITVLELEIGVRLMERRDKKQGSVLRRWLDGRVISVFKDRILSVDQSVALTCAGFHVPDPMPDRDSLIAATAKHHRLTVVTRDTQPFAQCGVPFLNPWE